MKLSFHIGRTQITILDTTPDNYDCSDLTDDELAELVEPCLANEREWDPVSQSAFEERFHRKLVDEGYYD